MGKFITLLVLLAAASGVYWFYFHKSPAFKTYVAYCAASKAGDCPTLNSLVTDGTAKQWVDQFCTPAGGMTVAGQTISPQAPASIVAELANSPAGAMMQLKHSIVSEDTAPDGSIHLVAIENVLGRPSNFSRPAPDREHIVTLKKVGDDWKVADFASRDLTQ